jgi:FKBP12-rapamycin complex-associated protein
MLFLYLDLHQKEAFDSVEDETCHSHLGRNYHFQAMVNVQMLSELEEVMQYKLVPERQEAIKQMWWDRLQGCQRVVEDWQKIIQVRSLVVSPLEDMKTWLKYASLCRKSGRLVSHRNNQGQ